MSKTKSNNRNKKVTEAPPAPSKKAIEDGYTWVTGFKDFFVFLKDHILFSIAFIIYHSCIFYILVASYNRRMSPIQNEICPQLNHSNYYNGYEFRPLPEGDLQKVHDKVIDFVRSHKSVFVEDLVELASPATLEQAEAAIQINGEFFIHHYDSVAPCKPVNKNDNLMIGAFVYLGLFTLFLIYAISPFSKQY